MAGPNNPPKLLGVDVQQVARCFVLVSNDGLDGFEVAELRQPSSAQDTADRGLRDADTSRNPRLDHSAFAEFDDQ